VNDEAEKIVCPCCGGEHRPENVQFNVEAHILVGPTYRVRFTKNEATLFDVLWQGRKGGRVASKEKLFNELYWRDPTGGPGTKIIDVMISHMRKRMREAGAEIEIGTVCNRGYFLKGTGVKPLRFSETMPGKAA
jgi:DNA-binding response OmpR family regulator